MDKITPTHLYKSMYSCKIIVNTEVSMLPPWDAMKADVALFPQWTLSEMMTNPMINKIIELTTNEDLLMINLQIEQHLTVWTKSQQTRKYATAGTVLILKLQKVWMRSIPQHWDQAEDSAVP